MKTFAAALLAAVALGAPAYGQTAGDINRLNAAIQVCNSPAGSTMAECAKLRGQLGAGGGAGSTAAAAGGVASLLGAVVGGARSAPAPASPPPPIVDTKAMIQQQVAACMQKAGSDTAAIQACLAIATGGARR